jgi:hypothetical protein
MFAAFQTREQFVKRRGSGALTLKGFVDVTGQADGADGDGGDTRELLRPAGQVQLLVDLGEGGLPEFLCNGPIRLSMIGCTSTMLCSSNQDCGGEMLSKQYLDTARTILRAAQTMTDQHIAGQLKALAESYERRAEKAARADASKALARSAVRECEALS